MVVEILIAVLVIVLFLDIIFCAYLFGRLSAQIEHLKDTLSRWKESR